MEINNMAAMREALVFLRDKELSCLEGNVRHCVGLTVFGLEQTCKIMRGTIEEALSTPPRNCDVGTVEEQYQRYAKFCCSHYRIANNDSGNCSKCPFAQPVCKLQWAQMPYEEGATK